MGCSLLTVYLYTGEAYGKSALGIKRYIYLYTYSSKHFSIR